VGTKLNAEELKVISKEAIPQRGKSLSAADIGFLVDTLAEKDDKLRYNAFLLLQANSGLFSYVYEYWDKLAGKLDSDNSYQRSLGIMLIAENVRWDKDGRFGKVIDKYLRCCNDEKFITSRQAIQGLETITKTTDKYDSEIRQGLANLQLSQFKENQQKLLNKDISNVLKIIKNKKEAA
jgi:hypothetical protein